MIPILNLNPEIQQLRPEIDKAIARVIDSTEFIMGPEVIAFEKEAADYLGVKYALGVNSGTDALVIALRAAGINPGDEVITTPFSFFATAESIGMAGAKPVFVDVEESTYNIDPALIEQAITPHTKAIMPVHLYGRPCEMDAIIDIADRYNLKIIEDCAQSIGARYKGTQTGTIGQVGAYSFFPSKNLGAFGDGGLIATNDDETACQANKLRKHGAAKKYHNEILGYNSRLDSIQAAILRVKLPYINQWNESRRRAATRYNHLLRNVEGIITPQITDGHVIHQYSIRLTRANHNTIQAALKKQGIATMIYYPITQDRLPIYEGKYKQLPVSKKLGRQVLSLPISPSISEKDQQTVAQALIKSVGCGS
ncbi:MAG: DegT/DnrJ/EryC1/StrS family aminotransferase [Balneolales bacterium]